MTLTMATTWIDVCAWDELTPDRGACALVGARQVALFRVSPADDLYAVSNYDPFSRANVLSRGIVGSQGAVVKVASIKCQLKAKGVYKRIKFAR